MKITIYLCVLMLLIDLNSFSQEINRLNNSSPLSKGKITLKDGTTIKFRNLTLQNDIIRYSDNAGSINEKKSSEVFKITKTGTYAGYGALLGGLTGILTCLEYSADDTQNDINYGYYGYEKTPLTTSDWVLITSVGTGIGALTGLLFKKETVVYKNNAALSFYPSISKTQTGNLYPMLSLKINLK